MQAIIQYYDIKFFQVFSFLLYVVSYTRITSLADTAVDTVPVYTMETGIWGIFTAVNFNPAIAQLHSNLLKTYINQLVETVIAR